MQLIDIARVKVVERQRRSILPSELNELKTSILERGLLQPPGGYLNEATGDFVLVWGERRLRAIQSIQAEGKTFHCDGTPIPPGTLPWLSLFDATAIRVKEAELDENIIRVDLDWQDRTRALAELHRLRTATNPLHTFTDTAKEIVSKQGGTIADSTISHSRMEISRAVFVAKHLDNPTVAKARNAKEAHILVMKQEEEKWRSALAKRTLNTTSLDTDLRLLHADCIERMPAMEAGTFDLILTDPPYGIDASSGGFRSRSVHHHNYKDTQQGAKSIAQSILVEGFRLTKPRANIFMFCHPRLWNWLYDTAANMGWAPFPVPLIWRKSESEGMAPWGGQGPRRTYDTIFYATKGQRGLNTSPTDVLDEKRVGRGVRLHAGEKPVELLRHLIDLSTFPHDVVFDPCAGSASTLVAAHLSRRRSVGIEVDETYYNTGLARIQKLLTEPTPATEASIADI